MWIYDGNNRLINTDMLLSIRAENSSIMLRRRTGRPDEDFYEFFLCGYPDHEKCKEVIEEIVEAIECGDEIYRIERYTGEEPVENEDN